MQSTYKHAIFFLVLAVGHTCLAENYPQFRGANSNAVSSSLLPVSWSDAEGKQTNILWKKPVEGEGWSQPIVWDDRVYMTSAVPSHPAKKDIARPESNNGGYPINSVSFSPDSTRLASAGWDGHVKLWSTVATQRAITFEKHKVIIHDVALSADGTLLASAGDKPFVRLWDPVAGQESLALGEHNAIVVNVASNTDGTRLVTGDAAGTVKMWDTATEKEIFSVAAHTQRVTGLSINLEGTQLVSTSRDGSAKMWNIANDEMVHTFKSPTATNRGASFSPDGKRLASAGLDHMVKIWDTNTGHEALTFQGHTGGVVRVIFSPDGTRLATASYDTTVKAWDARPWTAKVQAEYYARGLLISLRERVKSLEELQKRIQEDKTLSESVKKTDTRMGRAVLEKPHCSEYPSARIW